MEITMSSQSGRGGMGMHKHGVSGRSRTNKTNAMHRAMEVNRELKRKAELKKKHKLPMHENVNEVFQ